MKPKVYFRCENYDCEKCGEEIEVEKTDTYFIEEYCGKCHKKGRLRFIHQSIEAESAESFYKLANQMAKEYHLLNKLINKGVAEKDDIARSKEIYEQISSLECTGCGQDILKHEH